MKKLTKIPIWESMSRLQKMLLCCFCGIVVGCGVLFMYMLRAHTYLGNDSSACVNCHVMSPYYATWMHSSHSQNATCNDCHVPHQNMVRKYAFKGMDGVKHVAAFMAHQERMSPKIGDEGAQVVMNNCIRCHTDLNTTLVKTGKVDYMMTKVGEGKVCWDCHRQVPHGGTNSLARTPDALVPVPKTAVPEWLQKMMNK